MLRTSAVILFLLACSLPAEAGKTGRDLSRDVSRPLFHGMAGLPNSKDPTIDIVQKIQDDPSSFQNCAEGSDGCKFSIFAVGCAICGIFVFPILTFLCCFGFCCARSCKGCKCCGRLCCGEGCGKKPKESYGMLEKLLVLLLLLATIVILFAFSSLGFQSFSEMKGDYDEVLDGGLQLVDTPGLIIKDTIKAVDDIKTEGISLMEDINEEFSLLDDVKRVRNDLEAALKSLRNEMVGLQGFVEGCDAGSASCIAPYDSTDVLPAHFYQCTATIMSGEVVNYQRTGAMIGIGAEMRNGGRENPSCNTPAGADSECNCCEQCINIIQSISNVLVELPTDEDLNDLNATLPIDQLSKSIDEAMGDWDVALRDFQESLDPLRDGIEEAKSAVPASLVDLIAAGLFLLTWIVLICVIAALVISFFPFLPKFLQAFGKIFWWSAFIIGSIYLIFLVLPGFGIFSVVSLFMEGICAVVPAQGESGADLMALLEGNGDGMAPEVHLLVDDCVLAAPGQGYLWPAANMTKASFKETLDGEFNIDEQLNQETIDSTFNISGQTSSFSQDDVDALDSADPEFGVSLTCPSEIPGAAECQTFETDMQQYADDLVFRMDRAKTKAKDVTDAIAELEELAGSVSGVIAGLKVRATETTDVLIDKVWDIGKCTRISTVYEGLRVPLCDGVAAGMFGTWGALFIQAWFLYLLLLIIIKAAQIAYRRRNPDAEDEDDVKGNKVVPEADTATPEK